mgnify:CR=1 FL=1
MKLDVDIGSDYVRIYNQKIEICGWTQSEWIEDTEVIKSIYNAIKLAYTKPEELMLLAWFENSRRNRNDIKR